MANLPTRVLGGVTVLDTPLITKALSYARTHLSDLAYNHSVRSWLFGVVIASKIDSLKDIDKEVHAFSAILHDLGWDFTGELVSPDKRFEVDGANAARDFLKREADGKEWDSQRLQLVWDAIALHTTPSLAVHKQPEVVATNYGISADLSGPLGSPGGSLRQEEYDAIVLEFPRLGMMKGLKDIACHLCRTKPATTYDNFVGQYGEKYVEGFSLAGKRSIDFIESSPLE